MNWIKSCDHSISRDRYGVRAESKADNVQLKGLADLVVSQRSTRATTRANSVQRRRRADSDSRDGSRNSFRSSDTRLDKSVKFDAALNPGSDTNVSLISNGHNPLGPDSELVSAEKTR